MGTRTIRVWAGAVAALWLAASLAACDRPITRAPQPSLAQPPMVARADLFGDPVRHAGQLSPRGDRVAFLAARDGVTNLWVLSVDALDEARPLTDDRSRGLRTFAWAHDNSTLLYLQDNNGDENWRLFAVNAAGGPARALSPAGARAAILGLSPRDPGGVVITLNQRDADWPDVFRVDLASGERTLLQRNTNTPAVRGFAQFMVDSDNKLRLAIRAQADGASEYLTRTPDGRWNSLLTIPFEDTASSRPIAFDADGRSLLMLDSTSRDRAALVRVDLATGAKTVEGESARASVVDVWLHPATNAPQAFGGEYLRAELRALNPEAQADLDFLDRQLTGDFSVASRSLDDARWIVIEEGPSTPARSYLYDRSGGAEGRRLTLLFRHRPALEQAALQPMTPVEIAARDGLTLVSYLTLPIGSDANGDARPEAPVPLVLAVHGGPGTRDSYGFSALHQWLANRGYAVLSVNFRGSTGFGKAFLNAGNREWGARMQEDLLDAVQWAVENGIAEPSRVAIVGAGFGGYAALAGLAFTPEQFRCGASLAGPANLASVLEQAPAPARDELYLRVGDPRTSEGRQALRDHSPIFYAAQINRPLLLALGARDPRASRGEADQIAQSLRAREIGLTYLVFPDEGRDLVGQQNRLSFLAVAEHFLGDCLGGRVEPVGAAFEGAAIDVFDGAVNVPGLSAFSRSVAPRRPVLTREAASIAAPETDAASPTAAPTQNP